MRGGGGMHGEVAQHGAALFDAGVLVSLVQHLLRAGLVQAAIERELAAVLGIVARRKEGPAGEHVGEADHVVLGVDRAHAESVQLQDLAREVLVEAARAVDAGNGVRTHRRRLVEVEQHRRMALDRLQHVAEPPEDVRADGLAQSIDMHQKSIVEPPPGTALPAGDGVTIGRIPLPEGSKNLALRRPARQSHGADGAMAAVDGNTIGAGDQRSVVTIEDPQPAADEQRRTVWAVRTAARAIPAVSTCLTNALAAHVLLARRGYVSNLRIGVTRDEKGEFTAHAWLEQEGAILIGGDWSDGFTPMPALNGLEP